MELSFQRESLLKAIQKLHGVAATRNTLPILSHILVTASGDRVTLAATDLEVGMKLEVPAEVIEEGSITVPARKLLEIVRELPSGEVRVSASGDRIEIDYGRGSYRIAGLPPDEFPFLPEISGDYFTMDAQLLVEMIEKTAFAASTEESQYFFDGVYFHMLPGNVRMVASDGRRLAMINEPVDLPVEEEMGVIIPLKAVKEFADNFEDAGQVKISIQENQIVFQAEGKTLTSRLIEGNYPDYEAIIPRDNQIRMLAETEELLGAVKRVSLLADPKTLMIVMELSDGRLTLSASTPDFGEAQEVVELKGSEGEIKIAFMAKYIIDVLKNIKSGEVIFEFKEPLSPALVRPADLDNYIYLIMPMRME